MSGFSDTAVFFEARVKKARSSERQKQLADAAKFYRELATIVPNFPIGYKPPRPSKVDYVVFSDRRQERAEMCRAIANVAPDLNSRCSLLRLAETYDQIV